MTVTAVTVRIARKITTDGHPFSEVLYGFVRDGVHRKACSRLWYAIDDTPHSRANEVQAFIRRQSRN